MLTSARPPEQGSNPFTVRGLKHHPASPVAIACPCAVFQQQPDDAGLLLTRAKRTAASSPGRLNRKV